MLAAFLAALLLLTLLLQVGSFTLSRLGIGPDATLVFLAASLFGSAVNIPIARLRSQATEVRGTISVFGVRYLVPVMTRRNTVIAVNVGGAVVPIALSVYLIAHDHLGWLALGTVALVAVFVHRVARLVPGLGVAVPALVPGAIAAAVAIILAGATVHPYAVAGLAYAGGTLGTLAGADLANLGKVRRLGAPLVSIGGAGTFDGVFIAGIIAVVLASLI